MEPSCERSPGTRRRPNPAPCPGCRQPAQEGQSPEHGFNHHCACPRAGAEVERHETVKAGQPVCVCGGGGCWGSGQQGLRGEPLGAEIWGCGPGERGTSGDYTGSQGTGTWAQSPL